MIKPQAWDWRKILEGCAKWLENGLGIEVRRRAFLRP
jgi:hypothetical protein